MQVGGEEASKASIAPITATTSNSSTATAQEKTKGSKKPIQPPKGVKSSGLSISAQAEPSTSAPGKKKRRKKEVNTESKSSDAGAEDPVGKIRLKTVIRRLPPNVPEAIFWKAVSPWVVRPSSMLGDSTNTGSIDDSRANVDYGYFVPGKLKDGSRRRVNAESGITSHVFSRAYLHFTTIEALLSFHRGFDGHLFRDAKGSEYIAIVEFAPFQRTPLDLAKTKKADPKQGTIEEEADYSAFLSSLEKKKKAEDDGQTQAEKTDAQLMALLTSAKSATRTKTNAKHTPLLDHLRAQHTARAESSALKNARRYLDRNNNAYAASTTKAVEKGKGKAKVQGKDSAIPTGPKAGNKRVEAEGGAKKGARAGARAGAKVGAKAETSGSKATAVGAPPTLDSTAKTSNKGQKGSKGHGKRLEANQADSSVSILSKQGDANSDQAAAVASAGPSADRGAPRGRSRPPRGGGGGGRGGRGGRPPRFGAPASGPAAAPS